jgi:hypothetical protein
VFVIATVTRVVGVFAVFRCAGKYYPAIVFSQDKVDLALGLTRVVVNPNSGRRDRCVFNAGTLKMTSCRVHSLPSEEESNFHSSRARIYQLRNWQCLDAFGDA